MRRRRPLLWWRAAADAGGWTGKIEVRLELSTWPEVEACLERSTGILIPLGSTEQHGPTGLIGTDALVAEGIAFRAASESGDILVAPTLAYAPAQFNLAFPGTVSLSAGTFVLVVRDVVESLARSGFTAFYFLNGHGANIAPVRCACHDLHQRRVLASPGIRGTRQARQARQARWVRRIRHARRIRRRRGPQRCRGLHRRSGSG